MVWGKHNGVKMTRKISCTPKIHTVYFSKPSFFVGLGAANGNPEHILPGIALCRRKNLSKRCAFANQITIFAAAETFGSRKQPDALQQIGFTLAVFAAYNSEPVARGERRFFNIAVVAHTVFF